MGHGSQDTTHCQPCDYYQAYQWWSSGKSDGADTRLVSSWWWWWMHDAILTWQATTSAAIWQQFRDITTTQVLPQHLHQHTYTPRQKCTTNDLLLLTHQLYNSLCGCWMFTLTSICHVLFGCGQQYTIYVKFSDATLRILSVLSEWIYEIYQTCMFATYACELQCFKYFLINHTFLRETQ